jgi:hypothetical protein
MKYMDVDLDPNRKCPKCDWEQPLLKGKEIHELDCPKHNKKVCIVCLNLREKFEEWE